MDIALTERSESFFHQATARYYTQQALNKLADQPVSSLLAITYHNLAVHTTAQHRVTDGVAHTKSYVALLRQLDKLGNSWMQQLDDTQWLILKVQELWPRFRQSHNIRES